MSITLANFEFHRQGYGLVPAPGQGQEGSAIFVELPSSTKPLRSCTCETSRRKTCSHLKSLSRGIAELEKLFGKAGWNDYFTGTLWFRLAHSLYEGFPVALADVRVSEIKEGNESNSIVRWTDRRGVEVLRYYDHSPARLRFLERTGTTPADGEFIDRAALLDRLHLFQTSPEERQLNKHGMKTNRQAWEESFWFRWAYHCVREFGDLTSGDLDGTFHFAIEKETGEFNLVVRQGLEPGPKDFDPTEEGDNPLIFKITVPRPRVQALLTLMAESFPQHEHLSIAAVPLQTLFRVTQETELDMLVRPIIRTLQVKGQRRFYSGRERSRFRYGSLVYVRELRVLAELEEEGRERKFRAPLKLRLKRSLIPSFVERIPVDTSDAEESLAEPLRGLRIFKEFDYVQVSPEALDRSWFWLSIDYGFGDQSISLEDILNARKQGLPYLETPNGWIDLNSPLLKDLERLTSERPGKNRGAKKGMRLSASDLLRFQAAVAKPIKVKGRSNRASALRQLLELKPRAGYEQPQGLVSKLRPYQEIGVEWLRFLYEHRLGGLLCDDMGLGKTHQAMALMISLKEAGHAEGPFLVVCPTSVISHWRNKIRDFAPGLDGFVYHGPDRDFAEALRIADVIITSYGILRNDQVEFSEVSFPLAIFDEIQHIKNRGTLGYVAAAQLDAEIKLGLTGTPIENTLEDLKALFDLILPGYLGSDQQFIERYSRAAQEDGPGSPQLDELRRLISPFVLRRLKASVLDELPEKIEDTRTCELHEDQLKLYRRAIATRGAELVDRIKHSDEPLPYIHIFALLNHLKQICDHPALALKIQGDTKKYRSGKWDLFCEILQECLDAGLKVVVFTQYLGMISMIEKHLSQLSVEHVKLTGATVARGDIIDRFNEDPNCRVFLGSLKAGGTGIDLVGGSVVIHYDRWWNAAREDQATDRVHRIGQNRVVQVFKLVTEGTLEEKIAAIIEHKRELMESVVQEDDPHLSKIFSKEELLSMLQQV